MRGLFGVRGLLLIRDMDPNVARLQQEELLQAVFEALGGLSIRDFH